jgi:hypothetical protein
MKKPYLFLAIFIGLTILSCSTDNDDTIDIDPELTDKKLLKVTEEGNYGVFESQYIYDNNNRVVEIKEQFIEFGQTTPDDLHNIIFTYENDLVVSAVAYENAELYLTLVYNYVNNILVEHKSYTSSGTEDEKMEYFYNDNYEINGFNYYVEEILQQEMSFTYVNGNIATATDNSDHSEISCDSNPTPYAYFSDTEKIIFGPLLIQSLSNNNIVNELRTYNVGGPNESISNYETTITYDSDNYPTTKIVTETYNNNSTVIRTLTYEYE